MLIQKNMKIHFYSHLPTYSLLATQRSLMLQQATQHTVDEEWERGSLSAHKRKVSTHLRCQESEQDSQEVTQLAREGRKEGGEVGKGEEWIIYKMKVNAITFRQQQ